MSWCLSIIKDETKGNKIRYDALEEGIEGQPKEGDKEAEGYHLFVGLVKEIFENTMLPRSDKYPNNKLNYVVNIILDDFILVVYLLDDEEKREGKERRRG